CVKKRCNTQRDPKHAPECAPQSPNNTHTGKTTHNTLNMSDDKAANDIIKPPLRRQLNVMFDAMRNTPLRRRLNVMVKYNCKPSL
ncbi:Hypothetical predicted protein, partial [Pelobates cultripes]